MVTSANWQYIILEWPGADGIYRQKKRPDNYSPPVFEQGEDTPEKGSIVNADLSTWNHKGLKNFTYNDATYDFAFWSIMWVNEDTSIKPLYFTPFPTPDVNLSYANENSKWTILATAYYHRDPGLGGGDNGLFIDAFDINLNDFIADDFVDVTPDAYGELSKQANNGFIDTDKSIGEGEKLNVSAKKLISRNSKSFNGGTALIFNHWDEDLFTPGDDSPANIDGALLIVAVSDLIYAYAFYTEKSYAGHSFPGHTVPGTESGFDPFKIPQLNFNQAAFDRWWFWRTHGGLIDPDFDPSQPGQRERLATVAMISDAHLFAPDLQHKVLELAAQQLTFAADKMKLGIEEKERRDNLAE